MGDNNSVEEFISGLSSNRIIIILLAIIILILITKFLRKILNRLAEKYTHRRIVIKNFIPIINIILYILTSVIILFGVLRISSQALLALGVSFGVAFGFASQTILANVFGGLIIVFTRPFNIGDKISAGDYYGEVIDVSLLKVKIVTPDDSTVSIPAKLFLENQVSNANSGALDCQVVTEMMLPGDSDLEVFRKIGLEAAYSSPYTYLKKPVVVLFSDIYKETSMVKMKVKSYVRDHRFEFVNSSDIYQRIKRYALMKGLINNAFFRLGIPEQGAPVESGEKGEYGD